MRGLFPLLPSPADPASLRRGLVLPAYCTPHAGPYAAPLAQLPCSLEMSLISATLNVSPALPKMAIFCRAMGRGVGG